MSLDEAKRLIESGYTDLPPALAHLKRFPAGVDRKQAIKNAFLLGHGERLLLEALKR